MNVLALVTDAFGGVGGIAQYNRDLLTALARCGTRVVVVPRLGHVGQSELPPGLRQLGPKKSKLVYAFAAFCAAITEAPFDAVFCGHLHLGPLSAIIARILGVPLWLQLYGFEAWGCPTGPQRWAAECAAMTTAISRYTRRRFLRVAKVDPARVRVLPCTFDERFVPGPKPDYLVARHRLHGKRVLLTISRLASTECYKGHDKIIQALPAITCPDLIYVIGGEGEDRVRLEALTQELGVQDKVLFLGMIEPSELADYYRLADVFLMPSTQEGFGIVFLEAAASGLTPIGGNCDGSVDALADGEIGFTINPESSDGLVRAISEALAGRGPDPAGVRRFRFEKFARQVSELTSSYLLQCPSSRELPDAVTNFCSQDHAKSEMDQGAYPASDSLN